MQEENQVGEAEATQVSYQIPSLALFDWILAALAAVLVFAGLSVFSFPGLHPDAWRDAAVAAGLRPPAELFPGLWRVVVAAFYSCGAKAGTGLVVLAGRICAGLTAGFAFLLFRVLVAELARFRLRYAASRHSVQRIAAFCGAMFFACSDPMWCAGQAFTPAGLLTLITVVSVFLFVQFLLSVFELLRELGLVLFELRKAFLVFGAAVVILFPAVVELSASLVVFGQTVFVLCAAVLVLREAVLILFDAPVIFRQAVVVLIPAVIELGAGRAQLRCSGSQLSLSRRYLGLACLKLSYQAFGLGDISVDPAEAFVYEGVYILLFVDTRLYAVDRGAQPAQVFRGGSAA